MSKKQPHRVELQLLVDVVMIKVPRKGRTKSHWVTMVRSVQASRTEKP